MVVSTVSTKQKTIKCRTRDDVLFEVPFDVIIQSRKFKQLYNELQVSAGDGSTFEFPMPAVPGHIFKEVIRFCAQRRGSPEPVIEREPPAMTVKWFVFNEFEQQFLKSKSMNELSEIWVAARYLDVKSLDLFISQEIAARLVEVLGDDQKVHDLLGEPDDMTEEEKDKIRRENAWLNFC
ncbi:skp1-related protein [Ditylenchus destructor]|uniref:Skp1-related protein n=1 Tax=Ditylenchus destructor TaxID=166010 RepID=A0AAD4MXI2_9BILA|nr:skp1-related protein [Ditylenchus destructor]